MAANYSRWLPWRGAHQQIKTNNHTNKSLYPPAYNIHHPLETNLTHHAKITVRNVEIATR